MKKTFLILAVLCCSMLANAQITANKVAAIAKLSTAVPAYKAANAETLGEMGTECEDCPAIEVTKGEKNIKLYNPDKVMFFLRPQKPNNNKNLYICALD